MSSNLTPAIRKLAEAAGYGVHDVMGTLMYQRASNHHDCRILPDSPLSDAETTVVLGWLAKAGWEVKIREEFRMSVGIFDRNSPMAFRERGDTLNAALAAAVVALYEKEDV